VSSGSTRSGRGTPPRELLVLAAAHVGAPTAVADLSWDHGESAVWRVAGPAGVVALKGHRQRRKFAQELTAYREWLPLLEPADAGAAGTLPTGEAGAPEVRRAFPPGIGTPRLLAHRDEHPRGVVLTWERGALVADLEPSGPAAHDLRARAGAFLRALHDLPFADPDPVPLDEAYARRLAAWSERARGVVPDAVVADVGAALTEALPALATLSRVRCHRDYTPRNWLAREGGELVVLDFEHARPDLGVADLERLWVGEWRREPALREAFLAGYGRDLTADEEETLRRVAALGGLTTVVWAREHADAAFEAHGWDVLRWLGLA